MYDIILYSIAFTSIAFTVTLLRAEERARPSRKTRTANKTKGCSTPTKYGVYSRLARTAPTRLNMDTSSIKDRIINVRKRDKALILNALYVTTLNWLRTRIVYVKKRDFFLDPTILETPRLVKYRGSYCDICTRPEMEQFSASGAKLYGRASTIAVGGYVNAHQVWNTVVWGP